MSEVKILGIAGSLRKGSYNRLLLKAAGQLLPPGATLDIAELNGIPVFSEDDEESPPEAVTRFKARIRAADAILFATPEYNYSIPGGLKNAIDWASRPMGTAPGWASRRQSSALRWGGSGRHGRNIICGK